MKYSSIILSRLILSRSIVNHDCYKAITAMTGLATNAGTIKLLHSDNLLQTSRNFHYARELHTTSRQFAKTRNFYEVLGVPKNASAKDIKKAYYQLAKKYHPDTNKDDPQAHRKFTEVSEAYEVLSDSDQRKQYDMFGQAGPQASAGASGAHGFHGGGGFHHMDPEELFKNIFGDFQGARGGFKFDSGGDYEESNFGFGSTQEVMMNLKFEEAARGVNKDISVNITDTCPACNGSKHAPGKGPVTCPSCQGTGMETVTQGPFVMRTTCRKCGGSRQYIQYKCVECSGAGRTVQRKYVTVPVPAGVEDGQTVRMPVGKKEIFITFRVEKSNIFRREGADVHSDVSISISQAVLGGQLTTPGIYHDIQVKIPPGTNSHHRIRLPGKGVKRVNSYGSGDHYIHIKVEVPKKLTAKQRALILSFAEMDKSSRGSVNGVTELHSDEAKHTRSSGHSETVASSNEEEGILSKLKKRFFG
ncbi:protein tumorous imaginal discs, mitochondrial-like isoform X2 [Watersipora subatra]|uniref:protein tumorous imaginal discs, mitochondrial-like isoform X2 n=1 Tax=Watersipora subatra TaxID=2589382 RepID=UPI00355C133F